MGNVVAQPNTTFALASADAPVQNASQKVLLVAQQGAGASKASGAWTQNIGSDGEENGFYDRTSHLAAMVRGFKKVTDRVQVDAIGVDDNAGGVARVVDIGITAGPATEAGVLTIIAGSEFLHKFQLGVAVGDTAAAIVAAAVALINLDLDCPFTASVATTNIRLTADNDGTVANGLPVGISGSIAAVTIADPVESTAGAVDPTLTAILDVIGDTRYQAIVWPWDDTAVATALLDARFNASNAVLDGVAFTCQHKTHATHLSDLAGAEYNSQSLVYLADEQSGVSGSGYLGAAIAEGSHLKATYLAGIRAVRLTPDLPISQYVTTSAGLDQFGGPALASLPYFNTPITFLPVPGAGRGFTTTETEQLLDAGAGILGQNSAGSAVIAGEIPTTYLTDPAANPDVTWKFLNYVDTASGAREYFHNNVRKRFAQSRLTQGSITAGRSMANRLTIKTYLVSLYNELASERFTLVQGGEDAVKFFKDNIVVTIDMALGKATITMKLPILTQLRTIQATVKIDFDITR